MDILTIKRIQNMCSSKEKIKETLDYFQTDFPIEDKYRRIEYFKRVKSKVQESIDYINNVEFKNWKTSSEFEYLLNKLLLHYEFYEDIFLLTLNRYVVKK